MNARNRLGLPIYNDRWARSLSCSFLVLIFRHAVWAMGKLQGNTWMCKNRKIYFAKNHPKVTRIKRDSNILFLSRALVAGIWILCLYISDVWGSASSRMTLAISMGVVALCNIKCSMVPQLSQTCQISLNRVLVILQWAYCSILGISIYRFKLFHLYLHFCDFWFKCL